MTLIDGDAKPQQRKTPNWRQVGFLILYGVILAVGGCGGALFAFSKGFGSSSSFYGVLWMVLMCVFAIGVVMLLVAMVFMLIIGMKALGRSAKSSSPGGEE